MMVSHHDAMCYPQSLADQTQYALTLQSILHIYQSAFLNSLMMSHA